MYLCIYLSIYLSVCLSVCLSTCIYIYLFIRLLVYLLVSLFVYCCTNYQSKVGLNKTEHESQSPATSSGSLRRVRSAGSNTQSLGHRFSLYYRIYHIEAPTL